MKKKSYILTAIIVALLALGLHFSLALPLAFALLLSVNLIAFFLFGYDKSAARAGGIRIPERFFLVLGFLGASPAILIAALLFRHKTRDKTFLPKFAVLIFLQTLLALYLSGAANMSGS